MANNSVICGVIVDPGDYDRFANQRFEVPHDGEDMVTFGNEDGKRSLYQIEFLSKSADYKKYYPEFAEECRKIVEREKKNIQSYYAQKDGRKEYVAMKHNDFTGYLKDLQKIQKEAAKERRELKAKYDKAEKEWRTAARDPKMSDYDRTSKKMEWLDAEREYKKAIKELGQRTNKSIEAVREEFNGHLSDFYSANGDRLDDGVIRLLHSGIKLSDSEIDRLVEQNRTNPTMLRVIADHCEKNEIDNKAARIYGSYAKSAGSHEINAFNQVVDMIGRVTGTDETVAEVWSKEDSHFERLSNGAIANVAALSVHPETAEYSEN